MLRLVTLNSSANVPLHVSELTNTGGYKNKNRVIPNVHRVPRCDFHISTQKVI